MSIRKPSKPQPLATEGHKATATPNTSASTSSTSTGKRTRRAPEYYGFESSVCLVNNQETAPVCKRQGTINPVIETVIQEEAPQPPLKETNFELPIVSLLHPRIRPISSLPQDVDYDYTDYESEVIISVFDAENPI